MSAKLLLSLVLRCPQSVQFEPMEVLSTRKSRNMNYPVATLSRSAAPTYLHARSQWRNTYFSFSPTFRVQFFWQLALFE